MDSLAAAPPAAGVHRETPERRVPSVKASAPLDRIRDETRLEARRSAILARDAE